MEKKTESGMDGLSVRGERLVGRIVSTKSKKTAVVERGGAKYLPKFRKYAQIRSRITVHNPESINAKVGDMVVIAETRKISKTKSWTIIGLAEGESK